MEMGTLIDQQEETVNNIERTAKDVEADTDQAYVFVLVVFT